MVNSSLTVHPGLGISQQGPAAEFLKADYSVIQKLWEELSDESKSIQHVDLTQDYSENGSVLLAGRCKLLDTNIPAYWAIRDNRVHFSHFENLSDSDKMILANQALVAYANRSEKNDLKSAALAVSEKGHYYVAINTQEQRTMDWDKECAESNVTRVVKQLSHSDDKITRMYVLGGLTDGNGKMHVQDHLIGMCMRCVEIVSAIMKPDAKVTVIPANDGLTGIALKKCDSISEVKPYEAWQVDYAKLKAPSRIEFPKAVHDKQAHAFETLKSGLSLPSAELTDGITEKDINAFMVGKLSQEVKIRNGEVNQLGIAVLEITEQGRKRYEYGIEIKGPADNSSIPSINAAIAHAGLRIPVTSNHAYISKVYHMGYNTDGSHYTMSAEVGDRLLKRVGRNLRNPKDIEVVCIPLNDGKEFPASDVIRKNVHELNPTDFPGSMQHAHREKTVRGCC